MRDRDSSRLIGNRQGRSPWLFMALWSVWLPFLAPPIWNLLQARGAGAIGPGRLAATLGGLGLFVTLYLVLTWRNARRLAGAPVPAVDLPAVEWLGISGMAALSLALALLGAVNNTTLFEPLIFTSAYAGGRLPPARAAVTMVALDGLAVLAGLANGVNGRALVAALAFISVVGAAV